MLTATPNDTNNSVMKTTAGIGCYNYESIVKHDLYLFFYDDYQKNIYYLSATDTTGQIKPTGPLAKEIQSYFNKIEKFKMFSCIYDNKNEIWCIINDTILIFDYIQQEWLKRIEQNIETLVLIDNTIFTGGNNGVIYVENINDDFSGAYFPSVYQTSFINAASNTNLKKQKTPLSMEQYPFLRKNLKDAQKGENTNFKNETDRTYDHFYNWHNRKLYDYLIEKITDNQGKTTRNYKMMKEIIKN